MIARRTVALLRSQKTNLACALAAAALLGVGSFVMDRYPERYDALAWDDLRFFLDPPRLVHWWLYAAALAFALWGASALVCAYFEVRTRIAARILRPSAYGAALLHVCFPLALLTHLWGGMSAETYRHVVSADAATPIGDASWRTVSIDQETYPSGMPRRATIVLEAEAPAGKRTYELGYNEPIALDGGVRTLLLGRCGEVSSAVFREGGAELKLSQGATGELGDSSITLYRVVRGPHLRAPVADFSEDGRRTMLRLDPGATGDALAFVALRGSPAVALTERYNPSVPAVLVLSLLVAVGVLLSVAERLRRPRPRGPEPGYSTRAASCS